MNEIFVKKIRVLTPDDYDKILSNIDKGFQRRRFLISFWSGMRYAEIQRLHANPKWWNPGRNTIHLPKEGQKKAKRTQLERYVHPLPDLFPELMEQFLKDPEPPTLQTWNTNLKRWAQAGGLDPAGISAKTTRKTIESWMIKAGIPVNEVYLRQGHDELTSLRHYQGLPFTQPEVAEIKRRLAGWI